MLHELARDNCPLDLVCTFVYLRNFGIAIEPLGMQGM